MKSKHISIFMTMMIILLLVLSACQSAAPAAEESAEEPAAAEEATAVEAEEEAVAEEPAEEITITFWKPSWGIDEEYLAPVFEEFEAAHPGVKVEYLFHPVGRFA